MRLLLGLDPGGVGNFGWCIAQYTDDLPMAPLACGLSDNSAKAIQTALESIPVGATLISAGIDAPLFWSKYGSRNADRLVRQAIREAGAPHASGTVQDVNSLRGACLVQGMLAAIELREKFPILPITEAHPKALRWLYPEVSQLAAATEHERDALLAAVAAWAAVYQPSGWTDLFASEHNAYSPVAMPLLYTMPNVPYNNSFKPNPLRGSA